MTKIKTSVCLNQTELTEALVVPSWSNPNNLSKKNGERVKLDGYFAYSFEDVAIYSSKEPKSAVGIWINFKEGIELQSDKLKNLIGKKVAIYGTVNMDDKGHLGYYEASLDSVYCIEEEYTDPGGLNAVSDHFLFHVPSQVPKWHLFVIL
jgi:hypothetical protein